MSSDINKISKQYEILSQIRYLNTSIKLVEKQLAVLADTNAIKPSIQFVFHNSEDASKIPKPSFEDMMMGTISKYVPHVINLDIGDTDMLVVLACLRKTLIKRRKLLIKTLKS